MDKKLYHPSWLGCCQMIPGLRSTRQSCPNRQIGTDRVAPRNRIYFLDRGPIFGAMLTYRPGMRQSPTVRQKVGQVRRAGFNIRRMILPRIGQFAHHVVQVVVNHQMMAMGTGDDAVQLQRPATALGCSLLGPKPLSQGVFLVHPNQRVELAERHQPMFFAYSYAHGGKDRTPFPVDRETYDRSIGVLTDAVRRARLGQNDKFEALRRLSRMESGPAP